jgi:hypothetical protein
VEHFHGAALVSAALGSLKGYGGAAGAGGGGGTHPGAAGLAAAKRACLARRVHQELAPVLQVSCWHPLLLPQKPLPRAAHSPHPLCCIVRVYGVKPFIPGAAALHSLEVPTGGH